MSCNFGVLAEDEGMSFYSAMLIIWLLYFFESGTVTHFVYFFFFLLVVFSIDRELQQQISLSLMAKSVLHFYNDHVYKTYRKHYSRKKLIFCFICFRSLILFHSLTFFLWNNMLTDEGLYTFGPFLHLTSSEIIITMVLKGVISFTFHIFNTQVL